MPKNNKYGPVNAFVDIFLTIITGGLWLIVVFVREMRKRN